MRSLSRIRLTHTAPDFWLDVAPSRPNGQWLAVACLAGSPEPAVAGRRVLRDGVVAEGALA
jgi:hypothetical protein